MEIVRLEVVAGATAPYRGKWYGPGCVVEVADHEVDDLVGDGQWRRATPVASEPAESAKSETQAPDDRADRLSAIVAAIADLSPSDRSNAAFNEDDWLVDGRPQVDGLQRVLGWRPAAAERDEAWVDVSNRD